MNSLYGQYEIGYPQLESTDQATGASFGLGFDKAPIVDKMASPRRRSRRGPCAAAHGGAHRRLRSFVARVARLRVPRRRGGHYGALRARQVRRPAVCNLLQARARACQKRSSAVAAPRVVEQKPRRRCAWSAAAAARTVHCEVVLFCRDRALP